MKKKLSASSGKNNHINDVLTCRSNGDILHPNLLSCKVWVVGLFLKICTYRAVNNVSWTKKITKRLKFTFYGFSSFLFGWIVLKIAAMMLAFNSHRISLEDWINVWSISRINTNFYMFFSTIFYNDNIKIKRFKCG